MRFGPEVFLSLGLKLIGRNGVVTDSQMIRYRSVFGTNPTVISITWNMIDEDGLDPSAKPVHILWAYMFLKIYASKAVNALLCSGANEGKPVNKETFRKWSWYFVEKISILHNKVILWENRYISDIGEVCLVTVDGTVFRIFEPTPFWGIWRSHKFNGPVLWYEIAVCIQTGHIVWINCGMRLACVCGSSNCR